MVRTAAAYDEGPIAFRYPRGNGVGVDMPERGDVLRSARAASSRRARKVALLSFGTRLQDCLAAAEELDAAGLSTTVADARFAKPLDQDLVRRLARRARGADDGRGGRGRRLRQPGAAIPGRMKACSTAA